jgi:hypothetical protein
MGEELRVRVSTGFEQGRDDLAARLGQPTLLECGCLDCDWRLLGREVIAHFEGVLYALYEVGRVQICAAVGMLTLGVNMSPTPCPCAELAISDDRL